MTAKPITYGAVRRKDINVNHQISPKQLKAMIMVGVALYAISIGVGTWGIFNSAPQSAARSGWIAGSAVGQLAGWCAALFGMATLVDRKPVAIPDPALVNATELTAHKA